MNLDGHDARESECHVTEISANVIMAACSDIITRRSGYALLI